MAYDEQLADRVRAALGAQVVTEKKMFGGLAFLVGGHLAVAASREGGLMVRVDPRDSEALLGQPGVELVEMGGRSMRGWLRLPVARVLDDAALDVWVRRGLDHTRSLPPKR